MPRQAVFLGLVALLPTVWAQTWTACNPLNSTCPNDPAFGTSHDFVFNTSKSVTDSFNITAGSLNYVPSGIEFTVAKKGDSPTIQSKFYIMFGSVSVIMKSATGRGIISSIVLESDDLDEVDWEFLGDNGTHAESNYFGKGNITAFDRAIYHPLLFDPRADFHNYTVHWTADKLEWWIDSALVRTLPYAAANSGQNFPQTPMTVRLGIWAGGDKANSPGTIEWAGGLTDYAKGPYVMAIKSTQISDYGTGKEYAWSDKSGSWESIKSISGNSTALNILNKANEPPAPSISEKFNSLSSGTKLAVYCTAGGIAAFLLFGGLFLCRRTRRKGRKERDLYDSKLDKDREEAYRDQMELREKGLGAWDGAAYQKQDNASLGGWGGTHVVPLPHPARSEKGNETEDGKSIKSLKSLLVTPIIKEPPPVPRMSSPASRMLVSATPMSPRLDTQDSNEYSGQAAERAMVPPGTAHGTERSFVPDQSYATSTYAPKYPSQVQRSLSSVTTPGYHSYNQSYSQSYPNPDQTGIVEIRRSGRETPSSGYRRF